MLLSVSQATSHCLLKILTLIKILFLVTRGMTYIQIQKVRCRRNLGNNIPLFLGNMSTFLQKFILNRYLTEYLP